MRCGRASGERERRLRIRCTGEVRKSPLCGGGGRVKRIRFLSSRDDHSLQASPSV